MEFRVLNEKLGASTHGNPIMLPKGTVKIAENWKCTRDNIYTKVRGRVTYGSGLPSQDFSQLLGYRDRLFTVMANNTLYYDSDAAGTFSQVAGTYAAPESGYKVDSVSSGGNLLLTTAAGIQKLDQLGGTIKGAGIPKGLTFDLRIIDTVNWFTTGNTVAYRHVWSLEDNNTNVVFGAPSERQEASHSAGADRAVELRIIIPNEVTTSYTLHVYRSSQVAGTPPEDLQLVYQANPTSAEITAGILEFDDILPDGFRGSNLYTNTTQEGIAFANERPPLANLITTFKNFTFYANTESLQRLYTALISTVNLSAASSTVTFDDGSNTIIMGFVAENLGVTITGAADNGSGLVRITSVGHGFLDNEYVRIYDVVGTVEANGIWKITLVDVDNFDLDGSAFAIAYTSGGTADIYEDYGTTDDGPRAILHSGGAVSQNIANTAKSIVRCLNLIATNTYWYGYYASGANDPAGKMEFTTQTLGDAAFYLTADTIGAGNTGAAFSPSMSLDGQTDYVSTNDDFQNALMWSKENEGEAVPLVNIDRVGSATDPIIGLVGLRDSLFIIKEKDGVYRLTGETPTSFNIDEFDGTVECKQKNSIAKGENAVYMYSTDGYVRISDVGVEVISREKEKDFLKPVQASGFTTAGYGWYYDDEKAYKVATYEDQDSTSNDILNEYNTFTNAWTNRRYGVYTNDSHVGMGIVVNGLEYTTPLTGNGLLIERKDIATTDYSLPDISNTIVDIDTTNKQITLGTAITIHQDALLIQGSTIRFITAVGTTAVYTVSSTTGLDTTTAVTIKLGIYSRLKYQLIHGGYPEYVKLYDNTSLYFDDDETSTSKIYVTTTTDSDKTGVVTTIDETANSVWEGDWGGGWGDAPITDKALTIVPEEHARGTHLYLDIVHAMPRERVDLAGYSQLFEIIDKRYET